MKRVLIFSLAYKPFIGGAEIALKEITERINPQDIEFDMITLRFDRSLPKFERLGNINVHRIGFGKKHPKMRELSHWPLQLNKYLFPILALVKSLGLHQTRHYKAVWNMMASYSAFTVIFFKFFHPKVKYLLTLQEGDPTEHIRKRVGPFYSLFRKIFTGAHLIQVISSYLGSWARNIGYRGPLVVIPNGVDVARFSESYDRKELNELEQKLGKQAGDIFLLTTSRLVKKNACDDVIKALPLLPENIKFAILGTGPDEEKLREIARSEEVSKRVLFLGQIEQEEVPKYLKVGDIFIRPSLSEGFGISFIEAMSSGLPVIATQVGGISDFLFDPELNTGKKPTGRAVRPRHPEDIARAVKLYIEDKKVTLEIIKNALEMVSSKYDWRFVVRDMREKVFDKLLV